LGENGLESCWVGADEVSQLGEVGVAEESSKLGGSHFSGAKVESLALSSLLGRLGLAVKACGDAVAEVLDCPFGVEEGRPECSHALLAREAHRNQLIDLSFLRFG
jgi:hypothetical protein